MFVSAGLEHSVANMFLVPLGLLVKRSADADFWSGTGLALEDFADLTWGSFLVDNLLPVTLGNVVGGGAMIGLMYWTIFRHLPTRGRAAESGAGA